VFLDEIADAHPQHQAALLKVVAEGTFHRQGCSVKSEHFEGIIIGATWQEIESDRTLSGSIFRPDLLSRFEGAVIQIPALSERPKDVIAHAKQICKELNNNIYRIRTQALRKDKDLSTSKFVQRLDNYTIAIDDNDKGKIDFTKMSKALRYYNWRRGNARELRIAIERYVTSGGKKSMDEIIAEFGAEQASGVNRQNSKSDDA